MFGLNRLQTQIHINFLPLDAMLARYSSHSTTPAPTSSRECRCRRRGMRAYAVVVCWCVCVYVCLSVTLRYCIKTAKPRITRIMPHDSPRILMPKITAKFLLDHPLLGRKCKWGRLKSTTVDEKCAITRNGSTR